jgi:thiol-disulfide isomerase/thioredoxin
MGNGSDKINSPGDLQAAISNAEQMKVLRREADDAYGAYTTAIDNRKADDEIEKLWQEYLRIDRANLPKVFVLAKQEPASEPAFESFAWIMTNQLTQGWGFDSNVLQTLEFLRDHHATNPGIGKICWRLGRNWDPTCQPAMDFLRIAANKNPDREVRGQATLALARRDKENSRTLIFYSEDIPPNAKASFIEHRTAYLERAKNKNPKTLAREAEELFHIVLDQYADCPTLERTNTSQFKATLGDVAKAELYDLEHLSVGMTAPEIEGTDLEGRQIKLSDYRGKVVVLSFWASWCGPCMSLMPSEVELAGRMYGKPFAIVGVNGDCILNDAKHAVEKEKMTWSSFWSKDGPDGPIPTAWNVLGWPDIYVLDPNGVIRFHGGEIKLINQKVDQILSEFADKTHS